MNRRIFIGIDPGSKGACAVLSVADCPANEAQHGRVLAVEVFDLPVVARDSGGHDLDVVTFKVALRTALAMREPGETVLTLDHLPDSMLDELCATEKPQTGSIRENELEMIRQSLDTHQGNVSAAADALGISRATLYRKLKQLRS